MKFAESTLIVRGETVRVGLFGSETIRLIARAERAVLLNSLVKTVDHVTYKARSHDGGRDETYSVEIAIGGTSRLQWRFVGAISTESASTVLTGSFQLPRFVKAYFGLWFSAAALFTGLTVAVAARSSTLETWILPAGCAAILAAGFFILSTIRSVTEPAMQRVALQLDQICE